MSAKNIALHYAHHGVPVFPCRDREQTYRTGGREVIRKAKSPLTAAGFKNASLDQRQIEWWWDRFPNALIGIPSSSWWVLDLDARTPESRAEVDASLSRLTGLGISEITSLAGLVVETANKGLHLYFQHVPGVAVVNVASDAADLVDSRGHSAGGTALGFTIAPGSVLPDGRRWRVVRGRWGDIRPAPLPLQRLVAFTRRERDTMPAMLCQILDKTEPEHWRFVYNEHRAQRQPVTLCRIITGGDDEPLRRQALHDLEDKAAQLAACSFGRNDKLFRSSAALARYVNAGALTQSEIVDVLLPAWEACGAAGQYGSGDVARQVQNAVARGRNDPPPPIAKKFRGFVPERVVYPPQRK